MFTTLTSPSSSNEVYSTPAMISSPVASTSTQGTRNIVEASVPASSSAPLAFVETGDAPAALPPNTGNPEDTSGPVTVAWAGGSPPDEPPHSFRSPRRRRRWGVALLVLLLCVVVAAASAFTTMRVEAARTITIGASTTSAVTTSSATSTLQQSVEVVAQAVKSSVVKITSVDGQQESIGSGDILTTNGYIVTNDHVVESATSITVTLANNTTYTARIAGQDAQDDLAVIKISASNLHPITFANSSNAKVGEFALVVGDPLDVGQTTTFGIVSALNRSASEAPSGPASELVGLIQTSAQINPGNSGGALVNLQGQLLGIPTLEATNTETGTAADGIGYAIPASRVEYVATQLIEYGKLTSTQQGFLGIQSQDVTAQIAAADGLSVQSGVLIEGFANDAQGQSPAEAAGLRAGDVITAVNGQAVTSSDQLSTDILTEAPGTRVTLTIVRGTATSTVTVTLGERPVSTQG